MGLNVGLLASGSIPATAAPRLSRVWFRKSVATTPVCDPWGPVLGQSRGRYGQRTLSTTEESVPKRLPSALPGRRTLDLLWKATIDLGAVTESYEPGLVDSPAIDPTIRDDSKSPEIWNSR